jgi:translation initiation factor eIF-2B subunit beta
MMDKVDVVNPFFDYIPPEHISLFITNVGGHPPSYIYRLLNETYDQRDKGL